MEYQKLMTQLEELRNLISSYYTYNDYGEQPKMYEDDIEALRFEYQKVFDQASTYLDSVKKEEEAAERANMENADRIQEQIQKDLRAMEEIKPGMTLPSVMKYSNSKVVNVTGKTFKQVGDQCSQRQMMTITGSDGKPVRGFFTERTYMGFNPLNTQYYIDKLCRTNPQYAAFYQYAITKYFENPGSMRLSNELENDLSQRFGQMEGYDKALNSLKGFVYSTARSDYIAEDKLDEARPVSPFDTRNIAFSNVTHLLGMDDKIARSTSLTIRNNGKDIHGCFMEFAQGEDPSSPKPDGGFVHFNETSVDNSPALKTLSDMQVLDYICGNVDRHGRNLFYKFDENGKVIDFCGIDNDLSFGRLKPDFTKANAGGLKAIYHMSRSMCEKVKTLDEHMLMHAMDGLDLEKENRDYTIERLRALKERINEGKVIVIEDKDYENYKMSDFLADGEKEFTYKEQTVKPEKVDSIYKSVDDFRQMLGRMTERDRQEHFNPKKKAEEPNNSREQLLIDEEKSISVESLEMGADGPAVTDLTNKMKRAEHFVFGGSIQFKKVKEGLLLLNEVTNTSGKSGAKLTPENVRTIEFGYKKLLNDCRKYLQYKTDQGTIDAEPSSRAGKRIAAVRDVARFCEGRIQTLKLAIENTMDKSKLEKAEVRDMKNQAQKLMIEGMKPKEVGDLMKDLISMHTNQPDEKQLTVKLGQQMSLCMGYIESKKGDVKDYGLEPEDIQKSKALISDARIANKELKKDKPEEIREQSSKAAVL